MSSLYSCIWRNKNLHLNCFSFYCHCFLRVEEYISQGKDSLLADPDPNFLYTKRKLAKQGTSCPVVDSSSGDVFKQKVKFPESGWGSQLEKMPLFTKVEMNRYIENSGQRPGSSHHSVPTSWKKGKTFLEDEYLKNIECTSHVQEAEERTFKDTLRKINPKMGLANVSSRHGELVDTKYGKSPVGSLSSYQLSHTESNFDVAINIDSVARRETHIQEIESFPRFPLQYQGECEECDLSDEKKDFVRKLHLDEDDINELEHATRDQAKSERWKSERKYRFTASKFHLIAHRQRNHETFANTLMQPVFYIHTYKSWHKI